MREKKLGFIPSLGLPAELTSNSINDLSEYLNANVDSSVTWKPEIIGNEPTRKQLKLHYSKNLATS